MALTMPLPLKPCVCIKLELNDRSDERSRRFVIHRFEGAQMLLYSVMQASQLLTSPIFQWSSIKDHFYMRLVDESRVIVARFQACSVP